MKSLRYRKNMRKVFDLEIAKQITTGVREGKFIENKYGEEMRALCFNLHGPMPIVMCPMNYGGHLSDGTLQKYDNEGNSYEEGTGNYTGSVYIDTNDIREDDVVSVETMDGKVYVGTYGWYDEKSHNLMLKRYVNMDSNKLCFHDKDGDIVRPGRIDLADKDEKRHYLNVLNSPSSPKFNPGDEVLVRKYDNYEWIHAYYSHYSESQKKHVADCNYFNYCIPYNEETKHLVGKTDNK